MPSRKKLKRSSQKDNLDESSGSQEPIGDPTHGDGDEHQPKRKDVKKRVASHSESPEKVKDPLAYLNDDVVDIIFSFLPANTTEILRRVSKLWKAASERLNGARAFLAHFPNYKVDIEGIDDPVEANLRFRRRLNHEASLRKGRAQRAIVCTDAFKWHIHNGRVAWSSRSGNLSVRDLRSKRGPLATIVNYNVREIVARSIGTRVARSFHLTIVDINLTDLGDILLAVTLPAQVTTRPNSELMKLSPAGDILWRVNCWLLNIDIDSQKWPHDFNAVVCDDIIYTVEQSTSDNMAFTLRKLSDGSVISRKTLSKPAVVFPFDHVEFWSTCRTLSLFDNENKAMVIFPDRCCMSIIDVATGYDDKVSYCCGFDGLLCYRWRRTKVGQGSVSQEHSIMEDLTNPWSTQLLWLDTNYVIEDPLEPLQCFYDPSRELLFEMWTTFFPSHRFLGFFVTPATYGQTCYCGDETVEPKKSQSSTEEYRVAKYLVDIENERVRVTLPQQRIWSTVALEKQSKRGAREPIVKQLLTEPEQMSFFGLFGDYLVCHRLDETTLTILDFWPDW